MPYRTCVIEISVVVLPFLDHGCVLRISKQCRLGGESVLSLRGNLFLFGITKGAVIARADRVDLPCSSA